MSFLGIEPTDSQLTDFTESKLTRGDLNGSKLYNEVTCDSLTTWEKVVNTPFRRFVFKRKLLQFDIKYMQTSQTCLDSQLQKLDNNPITLNRSLSDPLYYYCGKLYKNLQLNLLVRNTSNFERNRGIYFH